MLVEVCITVLGILCSLPAVVEEYMEEFDPAMWETWVKVLPQLFLTIACVLRVKPKVLWGSLVLCILGLLTTYFCLLFNSRASASVVCEEYPEACADDIEDTCTGVAIAPWQGLLYLIGLCFMTIGSTTLIRDNSVALSDARVTPAK